ncbi:MAG: aminotransferase DegT [Omnitrophica bacterium RIFCSPHIGHO2_02_FULL_51_18]|nr:MAG: aminotransferase DegT [Omnitrophica bacterium RIFCSPHIGHO2_02_FULL_51_18]
MEHVADTFDLAEVSSAIRGCLPKDRASFELHEPWFNGNEKRYVDECIETGWVSSLGKFVDTLERKLEEFTGVQKAFALVNGTSALHMALKMTDVDFNDEVLVPDLTFVATANAVSYCGAIPHFVDSETRTLGMDAAKLEGWLAEISQMKNGACFNKKTGRRIQAMVPMHTFGHPVDMDALAIVGRKYNIALIEDAAQSLGSFYKGKHTGHGGRLAILSFNGNKICSTGGGGAILTNDASLGQLTKHIATTAKLPHPWAFEHDHIGYNYRMPNINAALGVAQLEQLPDFLKRKRALAMRYREAFSKVSGVRFFEEPDFAKSNYWLNVILLDEEAKEKRDDLLNFLVSQGIKARPAWKLMHKLAMYQDCPRMDVSVAENLEARLVNIPSSAFLGDES